MGITHGEQSFGPGSRDRRDDARDSGPDGALAALETFYHALNGRDAEVLADVLAPHPLAQLNNPVGGIIRGGPAIVDLYASRIFSGPVKVEVEFRDFIQYLGDGHAVFAGWEIGTYTLDGRDPQDLTIRTSRYFRYDAEAGRWLQFHHHGSIDDADLFQAYQRAVMG
jgi:hypothetical protein